MIIIQNLCSRAFVLCWWSHKICRLELSCSWKGHSSPAGCKLETRQNATASSSSPHFKLFLVVAVFFLSFPPLLLPFLISHSFPDFAIAIWPFDVLSDVTPTLIITFKIKINQSYKTRTLFNSSLLNLLSYDKRLLFKIVPNW